METHVSTSSFALKKNVGDPFSLYCRPIGYASGADRGWGWGALTEMMVVNPHQKMHHQNFLNFDCAPEKLRYVLCYRVSETSIRCTKRFCDIHFVPLPVPPTCLVDRFDPNCNAVPGGPVEAFEHKVLVSVIISSGMFGGLISELRR